MGDPPNGFVADFAPSWTGLHLKDHGHWMPVWVFGEGRFVFNLQQPSRGVAGLVQVGVLEDQEWEG